MHVLREAAHPLCRIKLLTGDLQPQEGHAVRNGRLRFAYFTQHVSELAKLQRPQHSDLACSRSAH